MNPPVDLGTNIEDEDAQLPPLNTPVTEPPKRDWKPNQLRRYAKRVWLVLEDNDNIPPTGQFIGHNGTGFLLRPGTPAEVPVELLEILNNCEYLSPVVDPATKQILEYKPRLRFPYRLVKAPVEQEMV